MSWTIAFIFLSIIRGVGTTENGKLDFNLISSIYISLTIGPFMGIISGFAQLLEEKYYKHISIKKLLFFRVIYIFIFLLILTIVAFFIYCLFFGIKISLIEFFYDPGTFAIYFYVLTVDFLLSILWQVNLMLGKNNLVKLLQGKFYTPREEERIFMFLDLQSSTQIAERLGHIKYSLMIQDCFSDLSIVVENEAEVYQYVGDEVILTWKPKNGLRNNNCVNAYFNFKQKLLDKSNYYQQKYACDPYFKAGVNIGIVTVTEVGRYKKEIAYHGDTINTAARIQSKCNELGKGLLVSEKLKNKLDPRIFTFDQIGSIPLKGKKAQVPIYAVA